MKEQMNIETDDDTEVDDFVFIVSSDGSLKSVVIPAYLTEDPPEEVQLILSLFGIHDITSLKNRTLH